MNINLKCREERIQEVFDIYHVPLVITTSMLYKVVVNTKGEEMKKHLN
jgi:hypothetical protein